LTNVIKDLRAIWNALKDHANTLSGEAKVTADKEAVSAREQLEEA
jgi:hypothetical protein